MSLSLVMQDVSECALQLLNSKCYCVVSVTKTFLKAYKLSSFQDVEWWIICMPLSVTCIFVTLATQQRLEFHCKALFKTPSMYFQIVSSWFSPEADHTCEPLIETILNSPLWQPFWNSFHAGGWTFPDSGWSTNMQQRHLVAPDLLVACCQLESRYIRPMILTRAEVTGELLASF
jgi:hypothetical protein